MLKRWSTIIGIAAAMWFTFALLLAGFARLTAICPVVEPPHTRCQLQANSEALDLLGFLLIPTAGLLLLALVLHILERR